MGQYNLFDAQASGLISINIQPPPTPPWTVALGAWTPPGNVSPWDGSTAAHYLSLFGRSAAVIHFYMDLVHPVSGLVAKLDEIHNAGATPLISLELDDYTAGSNQPTYNNASFEGATHDSVLIGILDQIGAWSTSGSKPVTIRPFWEFNYPQAGYPWAVGVNGNDSWSFINAWQRTYPIIKAHVPMSKVAWSPGVSIPYGMSYDFSALYPGDAYVDLTALDGYNKTSAGNPSGVSWSFDQVFGPSYAALLGLSTKPIGLFEVGCNAVGVDRAAWLNAMCASLSTPGKWKNLAFVAMWNNVTGSLDCRLDGDAGTLAAYRAMAANGCFTGKWA